MPFTAEKRLYVTADDTVVEEGDPAAVSLLVGAGGQLSDEDARKYGLMPPAPQNDAQKAAAAPVENKARMAPGENKAADDLGVRRESARDAEHRKR